jgi:hypothetical protein
MAQRTKQQFGAAVRAIVESLEGRRMLSATAWWEQQGDTLILHGTDAKDTVAAMQYEAGRMDVHFNENHSGWMFGGVRAIIFDGGGGRDSVMLLNFSQAADASIRVVGQAGQVPLPRAGGYELIDGRLTDVSKSQHDIHVDRDGILRVTGTAANDEVYVGIQKDPTRLFVRVNYTWRTFDLAGINGVILDGAGGDDLMAVDNYHGALHLPVTLMGGDGDDMMMGPSGWGHVNDITVDLADPGYMPTTLFGGAGNDTLAGGLGSDVFVGGQGDDWTARVGPDDLMNEAEPEPATDPGPAPEPATPVDDAQDAAEPLTPESIGRAELPVDPATTPDEGVNAPYVAIPTATFGVIRISDPDEYAADVWA